MKTTNKKTAKRPRASIEAARPPFLPDRLITRDDPVEMIGVPLLANLGLDDARLFDFRIELVVHVQEWGDGHGNNSRRKLNDPENALARAPSTRYPTFAV